MSQETKDFIGGAVTVVVLAIGVAWFVISGFAHYHDWDCSKHGGLLNAEAVYSSTQSQANSPGSTSVQGQHTGVVCKDGYVVYW